MGMTREQLEEEIDWVRSLVHNYYRDEETPILCHNDPHLGNMMIDENDKTGDSLVLIVNKLLISTTLNTVIVCLTLFIISTTTPYRRKPTNGNQMALLSLEVE